jgi:hypothetical protein
VTEGETAMRIHGCECELPRHEARDVYELVSRELWEAVSGSEGVRERIYAWFYWWI